MLTRFAVFPIIFLFTLSTCKRHPAVVSTANAAPSPTAAARPINPAAAATSSPVAGAASTQKIGGKTVVDQTAQVIVFGWHRFVDKVRRPDTEITPPDFEKQM